MSADGQVAVKSQSAFTRGTDLYSAGGFTQFGTFAPELQNSDSNVAGNATAIGVSMDGITQRQMR